MGTTCITSRTNTLAAENSSVSAVMNIICTTRMAGNQASVPGSEPFTSSSMPSRITKPIRKYTWNTTTWYSGSSSLGKAIFLIRLAFSSTTPVPRPRLSARAVQGRMPVIR